MGLHFKPTYKDTATKAIDVKLVVGFIGMDERFFSSSKLLIILNARMRDFLTPWAEPAQATDSLAPKPSQLIAPWTTSLRSASD